MKRQGLQLILAGEKTEVRFDLGEVDRIRVGRDQASDLVVCDRTVSRKHAQLEMEAGRLMLRGLGSSNGTLVNHLGVREQPLFPGDRVRFGAVEFLVAFEALEVGEPRLDQGAAHPSSSRDELWGGGTRVLGGHIADLSVADLIQVLASCGKTGTLLLYREQFGRIDLQDGRVLFAAVDGVEGEKAFYRLLTWLRAEFEFHAVPPAAQQIKAPTDWLLLEGLRLREEAEELYPKLPDLHAVLALAPSCRVPPPTLSPEELDVLRLVLKLKTLGQVLKTSSRPDADVFAAVVRLLDAGLLVDTSQIALEEPTLTMAGVAKPAEGSPG